MLMMSYYSYSLYSTKILKTQSLKMIENSISTNFATDLYEKLRISDISNEESGTINGLSYEVTKSTNTIKNYLKSGKSIDYNFNKTERIKFEYYKKNSSMQKANFILKINDNEISLTDLVPCTTGEYSKCVYINTDSLSIESLDAPLEYQISSDSPLKDNKFYLKVYNKNKEIILNKEIN